MAHLLLLSVSALTAVLLSGCAGPRFEPVPTADIGQAGGIALTSPIRLIGDTQFHESRGTPSRYASRAGDEFVPVTIRTGQQVIGAGDILLKAIPKSDAFPLTLHLGDAIDVSCQTEWTMFMTVMNKGLGNPGADSWLLTPGNHDGFYVGNFYPQDGDKYVPEYWRNVCNMGRIVTKKGRVTYDRITKRQVIEQYVQKLPQEKTQASWEPGGSRCVENGRLCVSYHLPGNEWESYLIQLVKLPSAPESTMPVFALLLDTSDYETRPYVNFSGLHAGEVAGISQRQLEAANSLIGHLPDGARFFVLGHHPLYDWHVDKWTGPKKLALNQLLGNKKSLHFVVTGHTHEGGWAEHKVDDTKVTELNVGSLMDAPVYYRSLSFERDPQGAILAVSNRLLMTEIPGVDCREYPLPATGSGYSVRDQQSESDRLSKTPFFIRRTWSAISAVGHFFAYFRAKHSELGPQLLAYADVVERSMPSDEKLSYEPQGRLQKTYTFADRAELVTKLRELGRCENKNGECHAVFKQHLLYALDKYYWLSEISPEVQQAAHDARFCYALQSAEEAGAGTQVVQDVLKRTISVKRRLHAQ